MGFVDPLVAILVSLSFLITLLYKRVSLGIVLNATGLLLAFLALDWNQIPNVIYSTTDPHTVDGTLTISVVVATFVIMLLSQLYKETGMINRLSDSFAKIVNNPKVVLTVLPAVIGLLPVSGGALMSAPLVDLEAEKLKLEPSKKAYTNLWFRHTIFPVYPISQPLIVTAGMTGVAVPLIILRQIPVVFVMVIVGYIVSFWKISRIKEKMKRAEQGNSRNGRFLIAFSPILVAIVTAVALGALGNAYLLSQQGFDVLIATTVGVVVLVLVSEMDFVTFTKPLKSWAIYGVTLAAYGAFFLRKTMIASGISTIFAPLVSNAYFDILLLLVITPAVFGILTGSPQGGVAISVPILSGLLAFTPRTAAMIYISAYLGYTISPTHLCLSFTAEYFGCSMRKMYKYVIPSFLVTFATALLIYFFF